MTLKDRDLILRKSDNPEIQEFIKQLDAADTYKQIWYLMNHIPHVPSTEDYFTMNDLCYAKERVLRKAEREEKAKKSLEKKQVRQEAQQSRKDRVANSPIAAAVEPLRSDAMQAAESYAFYTAEKIRGELLKANSDLNVASPYPKGYATSQQWAVAIGRYNMFRKICKPRETNSGQLHAPVYADVNPEYVQRYLKESREDAAVQYDEFIAKLVDKVGPGVVKADLIGSHVWGESLLIVEKSDGSIERWRTQRIINISKLGKVFNQWPTRKMK